MGRPGWLWLVSPKLKSLFPHASLLTDWLWREGGRDYKLISPHLSSLLLGYIFPPPPKRRGSCIWHMKAFKLQSSLGELSLWTRRISKATPNSKTEPNGPSGPEQWHHAPILPTSHTPQLIARWLRVSVRKAAVISGNKHFNTCAFFAPKTLHPISGWVLEQGLAERDPWLCQNNLLCFPQNQPSARVNRERKQTRVY